MYIYIYSNVRYMYILQKNFSRIVQFDFLKSR